MHMVKNYFEYFEWNGIPVTKLNIVWLVIYNFYGVLFFCCFVVELAVTKTIDEGRGRNITEAWLIIASAWTSN